MKYTQKLILLVLLSTSAFSFDMPFKITNSKTGGLIYKPDGKTEEDFYKLQVHSFYLSGDTGRFGVDVFRVANFAKDEHVKEGLTYEQKNEPQVYSRELYNKFIGDGSWVVDGDESSFTAFKAVELYSGESVDQIILWNEKSNRYELIKKGSSSGQQIDTFEFTDKGIKMTPGVTIPIDLQQYPKLQQLLKKNDPKKLNARGLNVSKTQAHHTKPEGNNESKPNSQGTPIDPVKTAENKINSRPIEQTLLNSEDETKIGDEKPKEHSQGHHIGQAEVKTEIITEQGKTTDWSVVSDHNVKQTEIKPVKEQVEDKPKEQAEVNPNDNSIIRFDDLSYIKGLLPVAKRDFIPDRIEIKWNSDKLDFDIIAYNKSDLSKGHLLAGIYQIEFIPGNGGIYEVVLTSKLDSSYTFNGKSETKLEELTRIFQDKWAILKEEKNVSLTVFKGIRVGYTGWDVVHIRNPLTNEIQTFNPRLDGIDIEPDHGFDKKHPPYPGEKSGVTKRELLKELNEMKKSKAKKRRFLK
jgi:hypothetical protein